MTEKKTKNLYSWPIWADLPEELLLKVSKCLKYSFQVGHFRAVCTSWRSAVPPPPHKRLSIVPKFTPGPNYPQFTTSKYTRRLVFRLELQEIPPSSSSSSSSPTSYLMAVEEQYGGDGQSQLRLLNPITGSPISISSTPSKLFPTEINLNKFRVSILHKSSSLTLNADTIPCLTHKVVYLSTSFLSSDGCKRKPTAALGSGKLSLITAGSTKKVILNDLMGSRLEDHNLDKPVYHDMVKYKEKWFAIDQYGRGVVVDSSLNASLAANPLFLPNRNGFPYKHKSYLVKSSGDADLFLVNRYLEQTSYDEQHAVTSDDDTKESVYDMAVRFRVYKLEEEEQCWKEVTSLNDQIIFVGDDASFWSYCVSTKDFPGCRGNIIFFTDQFRKAEDGDLHDFWDALKHEKDYSLGGFHMGNAFLGPMACFPGYTDFFWPPPSWLS